MNKKPLLSIAIPTYNNANHLGELLDSIIKSAQNFTDRIEVVILNDGSTDNTIELVNQYLKKYHFFKLTSQKNVGLGGSRNNLLKLIKGRYLWFIDGDDIVDQSAITNIINLIDQHPQVEVINIDFTIFYNEKTIVIKKNKLNHTRQKINFEYPSVWSKVFKTTLFKNEKFKNELYEDLSLTFNIMKKADIKNIRMIKKSLLFYRVHSNSLIRSSGNKIFGIINILAEGSKNLTILEQKTLYQIHLIAFTSYRIFKHKALSYKEQKQKIRENLKFMKYMFGKKALKLEKKQISFQVKVAFLLMKYHLFLVFKLLSKFSNRD